METKDYGVDIRSSVRGLWRGDIGRASFFDGMMSTIRRGMRKAWLEGAATCGISDYSELTVAEVSALSELVRSQYGYLVGFADSIEDGSRDNGGKLGPHIDRSELWTRRYNEAFERGRAMACADKKLKWVLGETEHCSSCLKLAGKVKRASYWADRGIFPAVPGARYLECRGYRCGCNFEETDDPLSRGPLPGLP